MKIEIERFEEGNVYGIDINGDPVYLCDPGDGDDVAYWNPIISLLVAAPEIKAQRDELLAACERLVTALDEVYCSTHPTGELPLAREAAKAAIARTQP